MIYSTTPQDDTSQVSLFEEVPSIPTPIIPMISIIEDSNGYPYPLFDDSYAPKNNQLLGSGVGKSEKHFGSD